MLFRRQRLRTKTGCLTCRKRRKKCSEEKPECSACVRFGLQCTWPGNVAWQPPKLQPSVSSPPPCGVKSDDVTELPLPPPPEPPLSPSVQWSWCSASQSDQWLSMMSPTMSALALPTLPLPLATPASSELPFLPLLPSRPPSPSMPGNLSPSSLPSTTSLYGANSDGDGRSADCVNTNATAVAAGLSTAASGASSATLLPIVLPLYYAPQLCSFDSRSAMDHELFFHYSSTFQPLIMRSAAHPGYGDAHSIYASVCGKPWVLDIFLALASLHVSRGDMVVQAAAARYHDKAVRCYWRAIESGEADGSEDWLLLAAISLVLYQQWKSSAALHAIQHLEGTAWLLRLRRRCGIGRAVTTTPTLTSTTTATTTTVAALPPSSVYRMASESFVYHAVAVSLFCDNLDSLSGKFDWTDIDAGLHHNPFPQAPADANSPILGMTPTLLYRIAFEVTRLSRHAPLHKYDALEAWQHKRDLDRFRAGLGPGLVSVGTVVDDGPAASSSANLSATDTATTVAHLYSLALEIFLAKLLRHSTTSNDAAIRGLTEQAIALLAFVPLRTGFGVPSNTYLCWPLAILACTVEQPAHVAAIKDTLMQLWRLSFCGHIRRTALAVERVWQWRTGPTDSGDVGVDTNIDYNAPAIQDCPDDAAISESVLSSWPVTPTSVRDGLCLLARQRGLSDFLQDV